MAAIDQTRDMRRVRRGADIIGLVELASIAVNVLLYPVLRRMPQDAAGSFGAELSDLILYLIVFALPFCVASRWCGMGAADLMGRGRPAPQVYLMTLGVTLGWAFVANWLGVGLEGVLNGFGLTEPSDAYVLPAGAAAMAVQVVSVAIVPPVVEELCYRGFFLRTAARAMGTWGAIVVTSFAFWLAHYSVEILPLAFGFGLIGGYVRERYGSLLPSMCAHVAVNGVYLLVNASWEACGARIGGAVSIAVSLLQILLGAVGLTLFVREGGARELWDGAFGDKPSLTPRQLARGVLTSAPALLVLVTAIYFTVRNLEVL